MMPRVLIAAPASGSGKTLITCGILQALVDRGLKVSSFKCGPDYIDPMFHSRVIGTRSKNLDAFFVGPDTLRYLFARTASETDISVIEGVMGYYDGLAADCSKASSSEVALITKTPTILLIDCKGASVSVLATLKGFLEFNDNTIKGVIFNRMSERVFDAIKPKAEAMGVKVIGYVPKVTDLILESRHLGLVLPSEIDSLKEKLHKLAEVLEESLDIDLLIELASAAPDLEIKEPQVPYVGNVRIGFAEDEAFCFTYVDNIELLRRCGAEIVPFSPIHDEKIPDVDGLVFSGGYPELHGKAIEANKSMRDSVLQALRDGMPCMAECGGFMYLHRKVEDGEGEMHDMCGFFDKDVYNTRKLTRFGYIKLEACEGMLPEGTLMKGHEFHYWDSEDSGSDWRASKPSGKEYRCIHDTGSMIAGFPHLYYYSNPEVAAGFLRKALEYKRR